jgi:hypothetical protein
VWRQEQVHIFSVFCKFVVTGFSCSANVRLVAWLPLWVTMFNQCLVSDEESGPGVCGADVRTHPASAMTLDESESARRTSLHDRRRWTKANPPASPAIPCVETRKIERMGMAHIIESFASLALRAQIMGHVGNDPDNHQSFLAALVLHGYPKR